MARLGKNCDVDPGQTNHVKVYAATISGNSLYCPLPEGVQRIIQRPRFEKAVWDNLPWVAGLDGLFQHCVASGSQQSACRALPRISGIV